MKKILVSMFLLVFGLCFVGCTTSNELNLYSYDNQKIMPSTIFSIKMNKKYSIDEEYKIIVNYGTLNHFEQYIYILMQMLRCYKFTQLIQ